MQITDVGSLQIDNPIVCGQFSPQLAETDIDCIHFCCPCLKQTVGKSSTPRTHPGQYRQCEFRAPRATDPDRAGAEAWIASRGTDGPILQYTT